MPQVPKKVHLVCNAHLDPQWVWRWKDALTETLSTFRIACDFCDKVNGFIFTHSEMVLYKWVEDNDPALFRRIQKLVRTGQWHIAGGSYVQPDTNHPSAEGQIRQFLVSCNYFREKFGVVPTTAYNYDSTGHSDGYIQILAGCGFDSYLFCRPPDSQCHLPAGTFRWRHRSGAEVLARRSVDTYPSNNMAYHDDMREKLATYLPWFKDEPESLILWGIGNHGGGPSEVHLKQIEEFAREHPEYEFVHSTPEAFIAQVKRRGGRLPVFDKEIQNCFCGTYALMRRVKKACRACDNSMAAAERMAALAWWLGKADYPSADLGAAWRDLLYSAHHDFVTGEHIPSVEKDALTLAGHCWEILDRMKARLFLRLLQDERAPQAGDVPIFVWNPHSFKVSDDFECEFSYSAILAQSGEIELAIRDGHTGRSIPFQAEQGEWHFPFDWRMQIAAPLTLEPFQIRRLEVSWKKRPKPQLWRIPPTPKRALTVEGKALRVTINTKTGFVDFAGPAEGNRNFVKKGALQPSIWPDLFNNECSGDPSNILMGGKHGLEGPPWNRPREVFRLATAEEMESFLQPTYGREPIQRPKVDPVHIVEDGPVRTIVEAMFVAGGSKIIRRYVLSRTQDWLEIRDRVFWNEQDSMLKIALPLNFSASSTIAETPYSAAVRPIPKYHVDQIAQRWAAAEGKRGEGRFAAVLNDATGTYSINRNTLYMSVIRSPIYASFGHELPARIEATLGRFWPRSDQGEHEVRYRFVFGENFKEAEISRAAQVMNIAPEWIIHYPEGSTARTPRAETEPFITVTPDNVQIVAVKKEERGDGLVVRLWEQAGRKTSATIGLSGAAGRASTTVNAYGLRTLILRCKGKKLVAQECNLVEQVKRAGSVPTPGT